MGFEVFNQKKKGGYAPPNPDGYGFGVFAKPEPKPPLSSDAMQMWKGDGYSPPEPTIQGQAKPSDATSKNLMLLKGDIPAYNSRFSLAPVEDTRPFWEKALDGVKTTGNAIRDFTIQGLSQSSLGNVFGGEIKPSEPSTRALSPLAQTITRGAGRVAGETLPFVLGGPIGEVGTAATATKLAPKFASSLGGRALSEAAGQALLGGTVTAGEQALKAALHPQDFSASDAAKNIGINAGLFGTFGAATPYVGQWVRSLFKADTPAVAGYLPAPKSFTPSTPLLPEPKIAGYLPAPKPTNFIAGYKQEIVPRRFRAEGATDRLNRVLEQIKPAVIEQTQTVKVPPLESTKAMINYISEAFPNISKNEIRKLSDRDLLDLATQAAKERHVPTVEQAARSEAKKLGYSLDQLFHEANQGSVFSGKARPISKVAEQNRLAQVAGVDIPKIGDRPTRSVPFVEQQTFQPGNPLVKLPVPKGTNKAMSKANAPEVFPTSVSKPMSKENTSKAFPSITSENTPAPYDVSKIKDFTGFKYNTTDVYRNFRDAFGPQFSTVKQRVLNPLDAAKAEYTKMQESYLQRLKTDIVDGLGIKKGSQLSAAVQKYGEKKISLDELKQQYPDDWKKVVKADQWFRQQYNDLIDKVNQTRATIYPNNPDKLVPKRQDYYRHFREMNGLTGLKNLFDTPSGINPELVGISEFTKPNSKFAGFMQRRGLGPYKNDAVGGFLEYLQPAAYATHIDPQISNFKALQQELVQGSSDSRNVNNLINYIDKFTKDLSGKTNAADRYLQDNIPGGRETMAALRWFNNRVKANVILGNLGSVLAQTANIPNGVAFAKQYSVPAAGKTLLGLIKLSEAMQQSNFLRERFISQKYRAFDTRMIDQPKRMAEWLMETSDRIGAEFVWNAAYEKGLAQKVADPIKYADDHTRRLIAGRGVGEVPLLQKSTLFQFVAPFTLEVGNQWRVMKDFVSEKDFAGLATLFVASYLLNQGLTKVRGSGAIFDPIQAMTEASADNLTPAQRAGRVAGEVLSNLPLGSQLASVYPQYGGKVAGINLPTRKQLFGDNDPTRFGTGLLVAKGAQDPLYKAILPFGGNQLKKTLQGASAIKDKGAYTDNFATNPTAFRNYQDNQLKFPIDPSNPLKNLQVLAFSPNATSDAQTYYKNERRPLSVQQTKMYEQIPNRNKEQYYNNTMTTRRISTLEDQIKAITKDPKLSDAEKRKQIGVLVEQIRAQVKK